MKSTDETPTVLPNRLIWMLAPPRVVSSLMEYVAEEKLMALSSLTIVRTAVAWLTREGTPEG
jgi:hypothetical protein